MTAKQKYQEFKKTYNEAKTLMLEQAGGAFKEIASDLFAEFPGLKTFGWTEFTPYFNDGDICKFSVNNYPESIYINGKSEDYGDDDEEDENLLTEGEDDSFDPDAAAQAVSKMLSMFEDDVLLDLYGDHAKITIHRDGKAIIEEYEHD